jgi:hypothetical protein
MKFLHALYFKKTVAVIFLALFVFIYAVKALHTHEAVSTTGASSKSTALKADFYCAICDFQLAKDCDTEIPAFTFSTPIHFVQSYFSYTVSSHDALPVTSVVRGPPAIA